MHFVSGIIRLKACIYMFTGDKPENPNAEMAYAKYESNIVDQYRVVLEGWPLTEFMSPSKIRTMKALEKLMVALEGTKDEEPTCRFCKLTMDEYEAHKLRRTKTADQTEEHSCKERCNKGVTCGPYKRRDNEIEAEPSAGTKGKGEKQKRGKENEPTRKKRKAARPKSRETVESDSDKDEE
jgi:hypothetical protein